MRAYKLKKLKRVHGIHFAPDGSRLLAVGGEEVRMVDVAVWIDLASGENIGRIEKFASCYAVDPQLTQYALGGADGWDDSDKIVPVMWTSLTGAVEWQTFRPEKGKKPPVFEQVSALAFDPAGKRLAISHDPNRLNGELTIVHRDTGKKLTEAAIVGNMNDAYGILAFSADGTRIAGTGGIDGDPIVEVSMQSRARNCTISRPPALQREACCFCQMTELWWRLPGMCMWPTKPTRISHSPGTKNR